MSKNRKKIMLLIILSVLVAIIIYGIRPTCQKGNLNNGYCETERKITTQGICPDGYIFQNDYCIKEINYNYNYDYRPYLVDYECPEGYMINMMPHSDPPGEYNCCYKFIIEKEKAKTKFYYWFNDLIN